MTAPTPAADEIPAWEICADCGCRLADHHKLRCEAVDCQGSCHGWVCPKHNLTMCGCTYLGGTDPGDGSALPYDHAKDHPVAGAGRVGSGEPTEQTEKATETTPRMGE